MSTHILPRDEDSAEPKCWIKWNTKIGPVWEVATCCLQGKYGVEIRIKSVNKDNSHSWVRISHGLNKLVTNLNNNVQETSEVQFEEYALKLNGYNFASRSKAKAKPQRRDSASSSIKTVLIGADIEPQKYSLSDYPVSKRLINLLRHGSLPREDDGAIEFWRIKDYLQDHLVLRSTLFSIIMNFSSGFLERESRAVVGKTYVGRGVVLGWWHADRQDVDWQMWIPRRPVTPRCFFFRTNL